MRLTATTTLAVFATAVVAGTAHAGVSSGSAAAWPRGTAVVAYTGEQALRDALAIRPARIVRRLPRLRVVELRPAGDVERSARALERLPGIVDVEPRAARRSHDEPALVRAPLTGAPQWQYLATRSDLVPPAVLRAAAAVTIAVIDTGADLSAPDLAAKEPLGYSVLTKTAAVDDRNGHGTFVASLAAGSVTNGEGIAGAGGDARLMVVQASGVDGTFTDVEEAAAIVWAVDHGARIVNLSLGGTAGSLVERRAVEYAIGRGVLLVAAVGNTYLEGNAIEYPAALLQPPGSRGTGGAGLVVAASNRLGERAFFSNTGTHLSLAAPGENVFAALSSTSSPLRYPRVPLPGSLAGAYGYGSGTSYAAPQVAGAAALVWAANPLLAAAEVATILEQTASGAGAWNRRLGFGVVDVAAAVARASGATSGLRVAGRREGRRITLQWPTVATASAFRVSVSQDGRGEQVLTPATTATTASYSLSAGSVYRFTVAALDGSGLPTSVSAPWTVSLRQARATLALVAARTPGSRRVELTALLRTAPATTPATLRTVVLESHDGKRWARTASGRTDASGRAVWRFRLQPGTYRVRARYSGSEELAAAASRDVSFTLR